MLDFQKQDLVVGDSVHGDWQQVQGPRFGS